MSDRQVPARSVVAACLAAALLGLSACQTERVTTSDGRPLPPTPRAAPATPTEAVPNRMILLVGHKPEDSDGNGYPDLLRVESALFAQPHPTSIPADGTFVFSLYRRGEYGQADAVPIREWRVGGEDVEWSRALYGVSAQFALSLLDDPARDRLPPTQGDIRVSFELPDGTVIRASDEVRVVQLGLAPYRR